MRPLSTQIQSMIIYMVPLITPVFEDFWINVLMFIIRRVFVCLTQTNVYSDRFLSATARFYYHIRRIRVVVYNDIIANFNHLWQKCKCPMISIKVY